MTDPANKNSAKPENEPVKVGRILSGMQATGALHIGHYLGVLTNFAHLQNEADCFFMVANLHSLTAFYPNYADAHRFIAPRAASFSSRTTKIVFCSLARKPSGPAGLWTPLGASV